MTRRMMLAAGLVLGCALAQAPIAQAQMGNTDAPAAGTMIDPAKTVDATLSNFETEFVGAAKAMPADKFDFVPKSTLLPGAKFDGVNTFAQQVRHVAQANFYYASLASGLKPDMPVAPIGKLTSKDEIIAALVASFAFSHKAVATLTTQNAFEAVKGQPGATRITMATFIAAHGFDHYGQMVEYLRMNGIIPPASVK